MRLANALIVFIIEKYLKLFLWSAPLRSLLRCK